MNENGTLIEYFDREHVLYESGVEYADWALSHVKGCSFGCLYCYQMKGQTRFGRFDGREEWMRPALVKNLPQVLDRDIKKYKHLIDNVTISFTSDPFPNPYLYPEITRATLMCIEMLNHAGIKVNVLTKGILPVNDLIKMSPMNRYGITVTSVRKEVCEKLEPGAPCVWERIAALKKMHDLGFFTFVSIEPWFTPNIVDNNIYEVLNATSFVDKIIWGRIHQFKGTAAFPAYKEYFNYMASVVKDFGWRNGIEVYIKDKTITPGLNTMCDILA